MPEPKYGGKGGLFQSLSSLAGTGVAIVHTRLDLLSSDLEEDRAHLISLLILTMVSLVCVGVAVVLLSILVVFSFWETHRMLSLGTLSGCWLLLGILAWVVALRKAKAKPRLFAASLGELAKDRQQLAARL